MNENQRRKHNLRVLKGGGEPTSKIDFTKTIGLNILILTISLLVVHLIIRGLGI